MFMHRDVVAIIASVNKHDSIIAVLPTLADLITLFLLLHYYQTNKP